jgi:hypothetical protein
MTSDASRPRPSLLLGSAFLIVLASAILPFIDTLHAGFLSDDYFALSLYQQPQAQVSPGRFLADAIATNARVPTTFYRPLAFATVWAETRLWSSVAWPFHLTNLLLHAGVCALTFVLVLHLRGIHDAGSQLATLFAVLCFTVFPRRVEPVAWIACRPDLLATLFAVAAAIVYVRAVQRDRVRPVSAWSAALLWFCSLLSKESAVLLPLALFVMPPASRPSDARWRWTVLVPFAVTLAIYLVLRRSALGMWVGGYGVDQFRTSPLSLVRAVRHVAYLVLPPIEAADGGSWMAMLAGGGALLALMVLAWATRPFWNTPVLRVGLGWMIVTIVPIAAFPVSLATTFNDRLLYLPGVGMACVLAAALSRIRVRPLVAMGVAATLTSCAWTATLAHHWHVAGMLSEQLIQQLAAAVSSLPSAPDDTIHLAAVPDSHHGAYMLRTAIPEALHVAGLRRLPRIVVLTRYFVERPETSPVTGQWTDDTHLRIASRDGRPALLLDHTPASVGTTGADRYGRCISVDYELSRNSRGRVLFIAPDAVHAW